MPSKVNSLLAEGSRVLRLQFVLLCDAAVPDSDCMFVDVKRFIDPISGSQAGMNTTQATSDAHS